MVALALISGVSANPPAPGDIWLHWTFDPVVLAALILATATYARGLRRGPDRPGRAGAAAAFGGGLAVLLLALVSPLNALTGALLTAHMIQYLLLSLVAPLLLMLGRPAEMLAAGFPRRWSAPLSAWWGRAGFARAVWNALTLPLVVSALVLAALLFWHVPGPFQTALSTRPIWWLEQSSVLGCGLLFWRLAVGPAAAGKGRGHGRLALCLIGLSLLETVFGLCMYGLSGPWYPVYRGRTDVWRLSQKGDQQWAGIVLGVVDEIPDGLTLLALLAKVLRAEEERTVAGAIRSRRPSPIPPEESASIRRDDGE